MWAGILRPGYAPGRMVRNSNRPSVPVFAQQATAKKPAREDLTIDPATMMQPWKGDLDGMIERRLVRVLTVPSKTTYFQDRGRQRGATYDGFRLLEQDLNAKLEREKKLKSKHLTVRFVLIRSGATSCVIRACVAAPATPHNAITGMPSQNSGPVGAAP